MKTLFTYSILFFAISSIFAQAPVVTNVTGGTGCSAPASIGFTATAINNATAYIWSVQPSVGVVITNSNSASPSISFPYSSTAYTVYCVGINGWGNSAPYPKVVTLFETPTVSFSGNTTIFCQGSSTNLSASSTMMSASSTLQYNWSPGSSLNTTTGNQVVATPSVTTNYTVLLSTGTCTNVANILVSVAGALPLAVSPSAPVICKGSSINLQASGAQSYNWSAGGNNSLINVSPTVTTVYTVTGTGSNNCTGSQTVQVTVNPNCSIVWPGDGNSDGIVNAADVFELGLQYSSTGAARSGTALNQYVGQQATNWTGTVSTGKNRCHADCNGDGVVNHGDTLAIYNNFMLSHAFRSEASVVQDVTLVSDANYEVAPSAWTKLDIVLGDDMNTQSLLGVAFEISFDQTWIHTDSAYIRFTSSFLDNNAQNVLFRKNQYSTGAITAVSVRNDKQNVKGSGKIGEVYFKVKAAPDNTQFNVSVNKVEKVTATGVVSALSGTNATLTVSEAIIGVRESEIDHVRVFPNPASDLIYLKSGSSATISYEISDLLGRPLLNGNFRNESTVETTSLSAGVYIVRLSDGAASRTERLIIK